MTAQQNAVRCHEIPLEWRFHCNFIAKQGTNNCRQMPHTPALGQPPGAFLVYPEPTFIMNSTVRVVLNCAIEILTHTPVQKRLIAYLRHLRMKTK